MRITKENFARDFNKQILQEGNSINTFNCGDDDLNNFIIHESANYSKARISVTYTISDKEKEDKVIAYFSLANDKLSVSDFNSNSEFNRFRKHRFPHEKILRSYPAVKLCRLGIDTAYKGIGLGSVLINFIIGLYMTSNRAGCRFVTVDAYNTAVPFYEKNGFILLTKKESTGTTTPLYYDLATL